jgi:hypothetical protein
VNKQITDCRENERVPLTGVESYLTKVADGIKAAPAEAKAEIRARIEAAKTHHEEYMRKLNEAKAKLDQHAEAKPAGLGNQIEGCKWDCHPSELDERAEKAECYAIAAIEFAAAATAEAELATLEAVAARMESDDARSTG